MSKTKNKIVTNNEVETEVELLSKPYSERLEIAGQAIARILKETGTTLTINHTISFQDNNKTNE